MRFFFIQNIPFLWIPEESRSIPVGIHSFRRIPVSFQWIPVPFHRIPAGIIGALRSTAELMQKVMQND